MSAKPVTPIFGELEQTAIENGYWGRAELEGVEIAASFSPYNGTTMKFRDTAGSLSFQFSGIDGDQVEQVARVVVAGIRAEYPSPDGRSRYEGDGRRRHAALDRHRRMRTRQRSWSHD